MGEDEIPKLSSVLKEIADENGWDQDEFLERLLKAIDTISDDLSQSQSQALIDCLDEMNK